MRASEKQDGGGGAGNCDACFLGHSYPVFLLLTPPIMAVQIYQKRDWPQHRCPFIQPPYGGRFLLIYILQMETSEKPETSLGSWKITNSRLQAFELWVLRVPISKTFPMSGKTYLFYKIRLWSIRLPLM